MKIDIKSLAEQSRLLINENEIPQREQELASLIQLIGHFPDDLAVVELLADPKINMDLREDIIGESLTREQALANAPKTQAGCIVVPQTV